ncbi:LysR family transcriptional regulator [Demequina globuliformis]|uniref:LysR family transcriptional regulator n=1 Tax=Demequina globuliformis TaxID=676202 RepID=UPI000780938A|nr:LysR family transcriptional regulator [Demequina globuliformis]
MLESSLLRTLVEFSERGTVAGAAQSLGYTPSAVSQQLAALTRQAGVPLTRRVGRRLVLTPAGTALAESSGDVLDALERAQNAVSSTSTSINGQVRLAIFQSAALALLPGALTALASTAPQLRLLVTQVEPEQALRDTWSRDYDVVVAEEYPHHRAPLYEGLTRSDLVKDTLSLCTGLAGAGSQATSVADCAGAPWVMEPRGTATRHYAEQTCRAAGFEPDVRFETSDLHTHLALVESGHAVTFLPSLLLHNYAGQVRAITHAPGQHRTVFTAMRESTEGSTAVAAVLAALTAAAQPFSPHLTPAE